MERRHLSFEEARDCVEGTDAGRRNFVQQYVHHDLADSHLFDLVVNADKPGPERGASLIAEALTA
jgi:hypothetical protein